MNKKTIFILLAFLIWFTPPEIKAAVLFDGVDDMFDCGSPDSLDNIWPAAIETKVYIPTGGEGYLVKKLSGDDKDFAFFTTDGGAVGMFHGGTSTFMYCQTADSVIDFDAENTIEISWDALVDASCSAVDMYVNGSLESWSSSSGAGTKPSDAGGNWFINHTSDSSNANMTMRYMAVYGREITAAEALASHNSTSIRHALRAIGDDVVRLWVPMTVADGGDYDGVSMVDLAGNGDCTGDDGGNGTGLTAAIETVLTY